jgi:hypothetical protein
MADIKTLDQYVGAAKQDLMLRRTVSRAAVAATWFSLFDLAGSPGAGVLAGTSTANGVVPTDAIAGYPIINPFGASAIGRLTQVDFGSSVACRIRLYDRVFVAGAYAFNANTALSAQPSFASRVTLRNPATDTDAVDYKNLELWVEQVTAATGNQAVNVTYTDDAGATGRTTGAVGIGAAPTVGRCWQLPYQAGDEGIQQITNVQGTVATVGTFNVMILRRLWEGRVRINNDGDLHDLIKCGAQVFADSALYVLVNPDSTATGIPDLTVQVSNA